MFRAVSRFFASDFSLRLATIPVAAATFVSILALPGAAHAQGLYQSPSPNLTTGATPQGVAAADFARSGFQSLVVTDSTNKSMTVYLATGPNTFASAVTYSTCGHGNGGGETGPSAVVAQDFNNDGYPDIVVACPSNGDSEVQLFLNNGTSSPGTFTSFLLKDATDVVAMVPGDFIGNGVEDLAVIDGNGGTTGITVYLNIGGTVVTKTTALTGTLTGIVAGDFNHDGHLDVAVSDSLNNNVHVLTGNGTGTFTLQGSYSTGTGTKPSGIVAADFNHDGNLDVATVNAGKNNVTVLTGSATGALTLKSTTTTGTNPIAISVLDVDSDGNSDVVAYDSPTGTTGEVDVLLGNGDGTLQAAQASSQAFKPGTVAAVADFNRDGKPDLALTQQNNLLASVLLNNTLPTAYPDGRSSAAASTLSHGDGNFADSVAVADFNKDGNLDLAVSYLEDNAVRVLTGLGNGQFNAATTYAVGKQPYWIAAGDLNGDGYPDLVTANTTDGTVSVLLNNKNGTFAAAVPYTVGKQPYQVAIGDLNGDGHPDLAVTNYGANTVSILFGSAAGTFTLQPTALATCANPYGVAIGDFEHNGFPSVAVTCYSAAATGLEVFPNAGNGTFGTPYMYATDTNPSSLVVGDFNRDGKLDIVVGNTTANDVYFFAGAGNNTFAAGVESPSLNFPDSIAAGDFNGDGILDIVGVAPNFNAVELTLGVGNGSFGTFAQRSAGEFPATKQPWALAVGDFNNDGQLDIVTANTYNQVNIASPAFQARYLAEYPAIPAGNPSIDILLNASAAAITVTSSPASPLAANNSGVVISAKVAPALSGSTPTGSVIFEGSTGAVLGSGAYALTGGTASYPVGHLGSGSYLFTSLYSGDSNFQPTTVSGSGTAITVAGTPVTLSLSPSTVKFGNSFVATVTAIGNAITGSYPHGTATIYIDTGGTPINLGTTAALQQVGGGNTSSRTITITTTAPNLNAGSYELYAVFNPTSGAYTLGSSSDEPLTVTSPSVPTSGTTCDGTYTGTFAGNITISPGQNCVFTSGGVSGNVTNNGGNFSITNSTVAGNVTNNSGNLTIAMSQVNGNVTVTSGAVTIGPGSTINGNVSIQGLPTGPGQNQICGTVVQGNLTFQNSGAALMIGSPTACAGNTVLGNLTDSNNTAATTVNGNTVSGNVTDSSNTAATQVFDNNINGNLTCQLNTSITGGGNTASSKQGQCATF